MGRVVCWNFSVPIVGLDRNCHTDWLDEVFLFNFNYGFVSMSSVGQNFMFGKPYIFRVITLLIVDKSCYLVEVYLFGLSHHVHTNNNGF